VVGRGAGEPGADTSADPRLGARVVTDGLATATTPGPADAAGRVAHHATGAPTATRRQVTATMNQRRVVMAALLFWAVGAR
jgi:hypothetical protein